jgi:hypothetical protein
MLYVTNIKALISARSAEIVAVVVSVIGVVGIVVARRKRVAVAGRTHA